MKGWQGVGVGGACLKDLACPEGWSGDRGDRCYWRLQVVTLSFKQVKKLSIFFVSSSPSLETRVRGLAALPLAIF